MTTEMDRERIQEAYKPIVHQYRIFRSTIGCVVSLILVPAGISLDWVVYPEMVREFFWIRILCVALIAAILLLHFTKIGKLHIAILMFSWAVCIQAAICYMIYSADGSTSTYYAGLNLVVLAVGLVLPFSVIEAVIFVAITIALYSITVLAPGAGLFDPVLFYNNVYFILLTGIIAIVALSFSEKQRFEEFRLQYNLELQNEELATLDKLKSQFFANVSHELRTPITLILGPLQQLLNQPEQLSEKVATMLHTARDNSLRLLSLVNDLLDLIQLEEGKRKIQLEPVNSNNLLQGISDSVSHLASTKNIELITELANPPVTIESDSRALEKIFLNLMSNAIKFTGDGEKIRITSRKVEDKLQIRVEDNGIGIAEDQLTLIFDRFKQADGSTTRHHTGTGIGLSLSKELAENLGGTISVESQVDQGSVFTVSLPITSDPELAQKVQTELSPDIISQIHDQADLINIHPVDEPEGVYYTGHHIDHAPTVLIVDDEPGMRRYLVDILRDRFNLIEARDGNGGLRKAREKMPDLMVLDFMLPGLDGLEVCRQLKQDPNTRHIKVVLLTARVDEESKISALKNGADDFLTKPFSKTELESRLQNLWITSQLEGELNRNNQSLKKALADLKSVQAQLIQSEKMNALGNLSAGILHEVNNPLNYALTAIQLLKREPVYTENQDVQETLDDIDDGMSRIKNIVSDLHTFAHPSHPEKAVQFSIEDAVSTARKFTTHNSEGIEFDVNIEKPDTVTGSQSHIVQVLVNLLVNAVKSIQEKSDIDKGKIKVTGQTENNRYRLAIRDNGVGINDEILSRVFDPFFTTRDVGKGMGMGLSICQSIVEEHGGSLQARSEHGKWAEFQFDLALAGTNS